MNRNGDSKGENNEEVFSLFDCSNRCFCYIVFNWGGVTYAPEFSQTLVRTLYNASIGEFKSYINENLGSYSPDAIEEGITVRLEEPVTIWADEYAETSSVHFTQMTFFMKLTVSDTAKGEETLTIDAKGVIAGKERHFVMDLILNGTYVNNPAISEDPDWFYIYLDDIAYEFRKLTIDDQPVDQTWFADYIGLNGEEGGDV